MLGPRGFLLLELEGVEVPLKVLHPRPVLPSERVLAQHQVLLELFFLMLLGKLLGGLTYLWLEGEHVEVLLALGLLEKRFFSRALQADHRPLPRVRPGMCLRPSGRILVGWRGLVLARLFPLLPRRGALRVTLYWWLVIDKYRNSCKVSAGVAMALKFQYSRTLDAEGSVLRRW